MRLLLRAGILLGLTAAAACKDTLTPVDFKDPVALSANLSSVDSAVSTDVARSFSVATLNLNAATSPAIGPVAALVATVRPQLQRSGAQMFLPGLVQARSLQAQLPNLSVSAADQGGGIADVSVPLSLGMTILFMATSLAIVAWIFKTGYRLKT